MQFDENQLKIDLQQKVMTCFNLYVADADHNPVNVDDTTVKLQMERREGVDKMYGNVFSIFSSKNKKPKRLSFNSNQPNGCWILPNITKHLENVHHLSAQVKTAESSMIVQNSVHDILIDATSTDQIVENIDDKDENDNNNESLIILNGCSNLEKKN